MWTDSVHMKTGSVRDLRNNFAKLEAWLEEGEQIQIEKRGKRRSGAIGFFPKLRWRRCGRQSTRLQVRLHSQDKTKGFSKIEAGTMLQQLQSDVAAGVLEIVPADWPDVHRAAPWSGGVPHV
jgi:hypothetical protein